MKRNTACLFLFGSLLSISGMAQTKKDSIQAGRNYMIDEVVVTGTRNETDVRHLPMTISVVGRHYQSWHHGIWRIYRSCRWHELAWYRW